MPRCIFVQVIETAGRNMTTCMWQFCGLPLFHSLYKAALNANLSILSSYSLNKEMNVHVDFETECRRDRRLVNSLTNGLLSAKKTSKKKSFRWKYTTLIYPLFTKGLLRKGESFNSDAVASAARNYVWLFCPCFISCRSKSRGKYWCLKMKQYAFRPWNHHPLVLWNALISLKVQFWSPVARIVLRLPGFVWWCSDWPSENNRNLCRKMGLYNVILKLLWHC